MLTSDTITKITPALIKAQSAFKPALKDAVNPAFARGANPKPSYVTLAQAIESVSEALRDNGIALIQQTDIIDARTVLVTRLVHESGEWIAGRYPVHPVKADPQGEGSALTYARRYSLMALVGIAPEDDDGNAAVKAVQRAPAAVTRINPHGEAWESQGEESQAYLLTVAAEITDAAQSDSVAAYKLLRSKQLDADEWAAINTRLDSKTRAALKKAHESTKGAAA